MEQVVSSDGENEKEEEEEEEAEEDNSDEELDEDEKAEQVIDQKLEKWSLTHDDIEEDEGEKACLNLSAAAKLCADNSIPPKLRLKVAQMVMLLPPSPPLFHLNSE